MKKRYKVPLYFILFFAVVALAVGAYILVRARSLASISAEPAASAPVPDVNPLSADVNPFKGYKNPFSDE